MRKELMKKIIAIGLSLVLCFAFTACNGSGGNNTDLNPYGEYDLETLVTLPEYDGFSVNLVSVEVTDEDVEEEIAKRRNEAAEEITITEGKVDEGDTVYIDYSGVKSNGETADRLNYKGYQIEIGKSGFMDGFDEHLYGVTIGEPVSFDITFPENYELDETLSNETVTMTVTVTGKVIKKDAELNEEFFSTQSNGEAKDIDGFKSFIKNYLEAYNLEEAKYEEETKLFEQIAKNTEISEIIEAELDHEADAVVALYKELAVGNGIDWTEYLNSTRGQTEEEFYNQVREASSETVKAKMITYALAKKENITVSQEEYDNHLLNMAKSAGCETLDDYYNVTKMHIETYAEAYGVLYNIYLDKVLDVLYDRLAK